jgi:hypothetical protein
MTAFEAGFIKYAQECGLSNDEAAHILKRAIDYPGTQDLFKQMPKGQEEHPDEMDSLANLLKQELIDEHMNNSARKIQL